MKVVWTATAQDHLDAIYAYIAQDLPQYALRMVDCLIPDVHSRLPMRRLLVEEFRNTIWTR